MLQESDDHFSIVDGDIRVSSHSNITRGVLFTLIMAFVLRHGLSQVATADLLSVFNAVIPGCLPRSKYCFNRFSRLSCEAQSHIYCNACEGYIGRYDAKIKTAVCCECKTTVNTSAMVKSGNFFLVSPLADQLKHMFENTDIPILVQGKQADDSSEGTLNIITDIHNGEQYRRLKGGSGNLDVISLTFNIDGVPVFNSSSVALWPVYHMINELPTKSRK